VIANAYVLVAVVFLVHGWTSQAATRPAATDANARAEEAEPTAVT